MGVSGDEDLRTGSELDASEFATFLPVLSGLSHSLAVSNGTMHSTASRHK